MAAIELDPNEGSATDAVVKVQAKTACDHDTVSSPRQPKFANEKAKNALLSNDGTNGDLLTEIPNILSKQEAESLVYSFDKGLFGKEWTLEGYDRQNRVQRYQRGSSAIESPNCESNDEESNEDVNEQSFGWLFDRIVTASSSLKTTNTPILQHRPYEVIITEHTPSSCRSVVDTWEQFQLCPCRQNSKPCTCYIANVTLVNNTIQHIEKPAVRDLECWDVKAPEEIHCGDMVMEENGVVIKMGDGLWNWRGRIADVEEKINSEESSVVAPEDGSVGNDDVLVDEMKKLEVKTVKKGVWVRTKKLKALNKRSITISFRGIHPSPTNEVEGDEVVVDPELLAKQQALANRPLSELLTIIVTTSPIRSNPSTEMLEHTFDTFQFAGEEFAFDCKKVIVCDGCRVLEEVQGNNASTDPNAPPKIRIYANGKQNLRNGVATMDQLKNYTEFKAALNKLCDEADAADVKSPFRNTKVVELEERHGYGFALRHALRHCVETPYVCVIQHDRNFMRSTPIREVVNAIICDPQQQIKYVGVNMKSNLMYYDIFCGKYGKRAMDEFKTLILRPKELCLDADLYGQDGLSVEEMASAFKKNRSKSMQALRDGYRGSHQNLNHLEWLDSRKGKECQSDGCTQLSLTPTLFWYDNTHIVETAHYRDFIFNPKYKMVARGGFVEDKLSPVITRNVERMGLKNGHGKFGCYILDDHSGVYFTGHLDGGSYKTAHLHAEFHKNREKQAT